MTHPSYLPLAMLQINDTPIVPTVGGVLQLRSAIVGHTSDIVTVLSLTLTPHRNTITVLVFAVCNKPNIKLSPSPL